MFFQDSVPGIIDPLASTPTLLDGLPDTSVYYAAPERLRGGRTSAQADVFAFGILLCEVLSQLCRF
jgi:serine/threonine protein kinase